jgi:tyrosine-protein kinase Etk/Wzc
MSPSAADTMAETVLETTADTSSDTLADTMADSMDTGAPSPENLGLRAPAMATPAPAIPGSSASGLSPAAPAARRETHILDLLIVLSRRKQIILWTTLAAALGAGIVSLLLPVRYTATATVLPPQQSPSLAAAMIGQLGALGPMAAMAQKDLGLKNPNDLYVGMLRSRTVEDALIQRFDLLRVYRDRKMSDAREDLEKASSIVLGKEGFVAISVEDKDRQRAPQIANAYVDQLRQLTQTLAVSEAGQRRAFFEQQLEMAKNNLADAEQALKQTEQKTGLIQLDGQAKAIIESVVKLRATVAAKEVELHARRLSSTEQNPDLQMAEQQLSGMRAQLALMEKQSGDPGDVEIPASAVPSGNVPEAGLQYVRKLREVKYAETMFELLAKQYEAARLDEAKTAAVIQVLDPAIEPDRKSSPHRALIVAVAALLGFFASAGCIVLSVALREMQFDPGFALRFAALKTALLQPFFRSYPGSYPGSY